MRDAWTRTRDGGDKETMREERNVVAVVRDRYESPLGVLELTADAQGVTGLWFEGWRHGAPVGGVRADAAVDGVIARGDGGDAHGGDRTTDVAALAHIEGAKRWLDVYFLGVQPDFTPRVHLRGTAFQREVWEELRLIPYGHTVSYGEVARGLARRRGGSRMAAQAVGGAVGRNPVSIIVPCHRVIGVDGSLTGYGGGLDKKRALLALEGVEL